uniref:Uncharacterized protein n=1 Tax=Lactuca sativa TaxID=4236 RepID=A0A9R1XB34_LACSA|nr:hypothetical protein LSAT_V11C500277260 [Lactuca sativa]
MLMNEISHKFHPYIEHIKDIRSYLYKEILTREYIMIYGKYFNTMSHSLNLATLGSTTFEYWLIINDIIILIANIYGVIVHYLSKKKIITFCCFRNLV